MIFEKPPQSITGEDIVGLVGRVAEGKTVDFKKELPGRGHTDKRNFLKDVSSFANASGGYLIYGIDEDEGVASEICGIGDGNLDELILSLENLIRSSIQPRIQGHIIRPIFVSEEKRVLLIYIPRSWNQPHVVDYDGHWRFYSRNSKGNYDLDIAEVRAAFALNESISERLRLFRAERLGNIIAKETPVPLFSETLTILHLIPLTSLSLSPPNIDFQPLLKQPDFANLLHPLNGGAANTRFNFDGYLTYYPAPDGRTSYSYLQLFRNGIVESVDSRLLQAKYNEIPRIPSIELETQLINGFRRFSRVLQNCEVYPPFVVMISLLNIKDFILIPLNVYPAFIEDFVRIDRNELIIPEVIVNDFDVDHARILQPVFDSIWNAAGYAHSQNYDDSGNRVER